MPTSSAHSGAFAERLAAAWAAFTHAVPTAAGEAGRWVRRRGASLVLTCQTARMISVLSEMDDSQLAQIGIERSDIPRYAAEILSPQTED